MANDKRDWGWLIIIMFIIWLAAAIHSAVSGDISRWFSEPIHLNIER